MPSALDELSLHIRSRKALPAPEVRRALRTAAGVSLAKIGRICDVSAASVYDWERGKYTPRGRHLTAYLEVLDVLKGVGPAASGPDRKPVDAGDGRASG